MRKHNAAHECEHEPPTLAMLGRADQREGRKTRSPQTIGACAKCMAFHPMPEVTRARGLPCFAKLQASISKITFKRSTGEDVFALAGAHQDLC